MGVAWDGLLSENQGLHCSATFHTNVDFSEVGCAAVSDPNLGAMKRPTTWALQYLILWFGGEGRTSLV